MKKFIKNVENFTCAHCGAVVKGNGYTNHCPECLWSRDVDINPGDRSSDCGGMMKPIAIEICKDYFIITHKCEKCGKIKRQHSASNDNSDKLIELSTNPDFIFGK
ncbi:MAG: RNHCP domain-containing protein [Alphaproteobacteria bacterium]|nr:RNHCP domain-containing protein [Alphaproteobacteria bacterium]MBN2675499.1 RNHCP domain-containing protein [Alphaproteobacteria bacterium]